MTDRDPWTPTRRAALERLANFVPRSGRDYAAQRNYDRGLADRENVSRLSPWIRVRAINEEEVARAVLNNVSLSTAERFIQEVCWRTYWKGWLELRPAIWDRYLNQLNQDRIAMGEHPAYRRAIEGRTDFDSFNTWANELVETGYLHNHARMWFASIWIHTLKLPWTLGAEFFLRHLLDGDAASNTLGWRWVAGLQTVGKTYAARASNIVKYTEGRLGQSEDFSEPEPIVEDEPAPKPRELELLSPPAIGESTGLLLTDDDASAWRVLSEPDKLAAAATALPRKSYQSLCIAESVQTFRISCLQDSLSDLANQYGVETQSLCIAEQTPEAIANWAQKAELKTVIAAQPVTGLWTPVWPEVESALRAAGIELVVFRRQWDGLFYPFATKGYFPFKKQIPVVLTELGVC